MIDKEWDALFGDAHLPTFGQRRVVKARKAMGLDSEKVKELPLGAWIFPLGGSVDMIHKVLSAGVRIFAAFPPFGELAEWIVVGLKYRIYKTKVKHETYKFRCLCVSSRVMI